MLGNKFVWLFWPTNDYQLKKTEGIYTQIEQIHHSTANAQFISRLGYKHGVLLAHLAESSLYRSSSWGWILVQDPLLHVTTLSCLSPSVRSNKGKAVNNKIF